MIVQRVALLEVAVRINSSLRKTLNEASQKDRTIDLAMQSEKIRNKVLAQWRCARDGHREISMRQENDIQGAFGVHSGSSVSMRQGRANARLDTRS